MEHTDDNDDVKQEGTSSKNQRDRSCHLISDQINPEFMFSLVYSSAEEPSQTAFLAEVKERAEVLSKNVRATPEQVTSVNDSAEKDDEMEQYLAIIRATETLVKNPALMGDTSGKPLEVVVDFSCIPNVPITLNFDAQHFKASLAQRTLTRRRKPQTKTLILDEQSWFPKLPEGVESSDDEEPESAPSPEPPRSPVSRASPMRPPMGMPGGLMSDLGNMLKKRASPKGKEPSPVKAKTLPVKTSESSVLKKTPKAPARPAKPSKAVDQTDGSSPGRKKQAILPPVAKPRAQKTLSSPQSVTSAALIESALLNKRASKEADDKSEQEAPSWMKELESKKKHPVAAQPMQTPDAESGVKPDWLKKLKGKNKDNVKESQNVDANESGTSSKARLDVVQIEIAKKDVDMTPADVVVDMSVHGVKHDDGVDMSVRSVKYTDGIDLSVHGVRHVAEKREGEIVHSDNIDVKKVKLVDVPDGARKPLPTVPKKPYATKPKPTSPRTPPASPTGSPAPSEGMMVDSCRTADKDDVMMIHDSEKSHDKLTFELSSKMDVTTDVDQNEDNLFYVASVQGISDVSGDYNNAPLVNVADSLNAKENNILSGLNVNELNEKNKPEEESPSSAQNITENLINFDEPKVDSEAVNDNSLATLTTEESGDIHHDNEAKPEPASDAVLIGAKFIGDKQDVEQLDNVASSSLEPHLEHLDTEQSEGVLIPLAEGKLDCNDNDSLIESCATPSPREEDSDLTFLDKEEPPLLRESVKIKESFIPSLSESPLSSSSASSFTELDVKLESTTQQLAMQTEDSKQDQDANKQTELESDVTERHVVAELEEDNQRGNPLFTTSSLESTEMSSDKGKAYHIQADNVSSNDQSKDIVPCLLENVMSKQEQIEDDLPEALNHKDHSHVEGLQENREKDLCTTEKTSSPPQLLDDNNELFTSSREISTEEEPTPNLSTEDDRTLPLSPDVELHEVPSTATETTAPENINGTLGISVLPQRPFKLTTRYDERLSEPVKRSGSGKLIRVNSMEAAPVSRPRVVMKRWSMNESAPPDESEGSLRADPSKDEPMDGDLWNTSDNMFESTKTAVNGSQQKASSPGSTSSGDGDSRRRLISVEAGTIQEPISRQGPKESCKGIKSSHSDSNNSKAELYEQQPCTAADEDSAPPPRPKSPCESRPPPPRRPKPPPKPRKLSSSSESSVEAKERHSEILSMLSSPRDTDVPTMQSRRESVTAMDKEIPSMVKSARAYQAKQAMQKQGHPASVPHWQRKAHTLQSAGLTRNSKPGVPPKPMPKPKAKVPPPSPSLTAALQKKPWSETEKLERQMKTRSLPPQSSHSLKAVPIETEPIVSEIDLKIAEFRRQRDDADKSKVLRVPAFIREFATKTRSHSAPTADTSKATNSQQQEPDWLLQRRKHVDAVTCEDSGA